MIQMAQTQLKREVPSPKTVILYLLMFVVNLSFFLAKIYNLDPTLTLILWENLSAFMLSPLALAGFEPPST